MKVWLIHSKMHMCRVKYDQFWSMHIPEALTTVKMMNTFVIPLGGSIFPMKETPEKWKHIHALK